MVSTSIEAENGVDALELLATEHVDMLIVDWQMPMMNGIKLVRTLRRNPLYADLPIVMMSSSDDLAARKEAQSLGVMTWLTKPLRVADVERIVAVGLGMNACPVE